MTDTPPFDLERSGLVLLAANPAVLAAFYRDVLGLPELFRREGADWRLICLRFGSAYLMIESGGGPAAAKKSPAANPVALRFNVADIDAAIAELRRRGVTVARRDLDWGTVADFYDPEGNRCQLRDTESFPTPA